MNGSLALEMEVDARVSERAELRQSPGDPAASPSTAQLTTAPAFGRIRITTWRKP